jgi:tRNA nucleotidyltransferase (CCA-adding enzyme)
LQSFAYLALLCYRLDTTALEAVAARLKIPTAQVASLRQIEALKSKRPDLARRQKPSVLVRLLEDISDEALFVAWAAADSKLAARQIQRYVCKLRDVRPELDGKYLQSLGIKPGPELGRFLDALRNALLDGVVRTRAEQEAFVKERVERRE